MAAPLFMSVSAEIDAPAALLWSIVADYTYDPKWRVGVLSMEQTSKGVVVDGTETLEKFTMMGTKSLNRAKIADVVVGRSFSWKTVGGVVAQGTREVTALGPDRSRLEIKTEYRPRGAEVLIAGVIKRSFQKSLELSVQRLGLLVEHEAKNAKKK